LFFLSSGKAPIKNNVERRKVLRNRNGKDKTGIAYASRN